MHGEGLLLAGTPVYLEMNSLRVAAGGDHLSNLRVELYLGGFATMSRPATQMCDRSRAGSRGTAILASSQQTSKIVDGS